ncbi:hypothetical protein OO013_08575 [Mangrovivirga sp. M17]|uniref:Uncharacterized protein n=1 Tax=Mangrovivirga halotolerans TaxID=2993936 RepID=A0ABT3RQ47_9BACT|nr:hypothetical protein [Mangrovivirga halotolerans]MCX2743918.1 hypothetical protein [Mangrovivirga halotolerans]
MKKSLLYMGLFLSLILLPSHIGSPGVTLEGAAGPYNLTVVVNSPDVIPGTASVDIYTTDRGIDSITVKPMYWYAGTKGTPKSDPALPVEGEPGHYRAEVWLMSSGTAGISVNVTGNDGDGEILVPVMAVSTAKKEMEASLGWTLAGLGLFLVILMTTIISLSIKDSQRDPGEKPDKNAKRKRWTGAFIGMIILILILWGGNNWWKSWAKNYSRYMYKPYTATTEIKNSNGVQKLVFNIDSTKLESLYLTRSLNYLVPDHGKIMHMFLLRENKLDVFAHLHPTRVDSSTFETIIPPLPPGNYYVFTDVSRLSGFSETIADTVTIGTPSEQLISSWSDSLLMDVDDTYYITDPFIKDTEKDILPGGDIVICGSPGERTRLPDSSWVTLELPEEKVFRSGQLYDLTIVVDDPQGNPAELQPYLGMMGHAVVFKSDGSVYIHLHPVGSYSTASQQTMLSRFQGESGMVDWDNLPDPEIFMDSVDNYIAYLNKLPDKEREEILLADMDHDYDVNDPEHEEHSSVSFPYTFPTPGNYRIYVQMKRNGRILNGAFDVVVEE